MSHPRRPHARRAALLALLCAGLGACRSTPLPESLPATPPPQEVLARYATLGPGDVLRVGVYGHPELSTPESAGFVGSRVDVEGNLSLPLVGAVAVDGLTIGAARERIEAAFAAYVRDPKVDVSVIEHGARRFYLYGEINEPGAHVADRPLTVYQALSFGKGFTKSARRDEVVLLRRVGEEVEVHVIDGARPDASGLAWVLPDDFLFVRRSGAGRFADEVLPILQGISSSLSSVATVLLIEDRLSEGN